MSNLTDLAHKLDSADEAERIYAAEDIGYLNGPDGVLALLGRMSNEPSRTVRDAIFQALIRIDADAAIEGAIQLLGSGDAQIRNQAVDVLRRKGARSVPFLNAVMRDGDKHMRKLVLDVLSGIQASDAGDIYAAALSDPDPNVVITAVENLGSMRATEFRGRIEDLLKADAHPMLIVACIEALTGIGNESSLAVIRRSFPVFAKLPDFLLASCLKAVAALGSHSDFAEVAGLLPSRGLQLRPAILSALLAICPESQTDDACEDLRQALRDVVLSADPPLGRYQAVRVLGCWAAARDDVYLFLAGCLGDPERLVRLGAIEVLRRAGRPGVDALLAAQALEETDEEVLQALTP
jgi:HEAT repeat protein